MSEPVTPVGWAAILAAVLLPTVVALLWIAAVERDHRAREIVRTADLEARLLSQERELAALRQQVRELEEDLDLAIELD